MKKFTKIITLALAAIFVAACFTACSGNTEKEKLSMATNATFPPYEFIEGTDYKGIDVEIAQEIANKLDMELEINDIEFGAIIGGVQSGKYSMGMAGITADDTRRKSVDFTESYTTGVQVVIVREDSDIKTLDDINGKKIGVQQDTTGDIYASDDYGEESVIRYNKGADAVQALKTNKVDCVIIDNEPAKSFVSANEGLTILDTEYAIEDYAICVSKNNPELLKKIDEALAELKADGTVQKIIDKYIPA